MYRDLSDLCSHIVSFSAPSQERVSTTSALNTDRSSSAVYACECGVCARPSCSSPEVAEFFRFCAAYGVKIVYAP
jgi:hypothetical protein